MVPLSPVIGPGTGAVPIKSQSCRNSGATPPGHTALVVGTHVACRQNSSGGPPSGTPRASNWTQISGCLAPIAHAGSAPPVLGSLYSTDLFPFSILAFLVTGALSGGAGNFPEMGKSSQPHSWGQPATGSWDLTKVSRVPSRCHQTVTKQK